jgi:hypothetical protein
MKRTSALVAMLAATPAMAAGFYVNNGANDVFLPDYDGVKFPALVTACTDENMKKDAEMVTHYSARNQPWPWMPKTYEQTALACLHKIIEMCLSMSAAKDRNSVTKCLQYNETREAQRAKDRDSDWRARLNECMLRNHVPGTNPMTTSRLCFAVTPR